MRASAACLVVMVGGVLVGAACGGDGVVEGPPAVTPDASPRGSLRVSAPSALRTAERAGPATFTIALASRPTSSVVVPVVSSNEGEVVARPSALTFSPEDWSEPKVVTLQGQDDEVADGDQRVEVRVGPSTSSDGAYQGVVGEVLEVLNADDDQAVIEVSAPSPAERTTEAGGKVSFTVRLKARPRGNVSIGVASSDPAEGTVDRSTLVFTPEAWREPQMVTVTGQNDVVADGDRAFVVTLAPATSMDPAYAGQDAADVALVNEDDDTPGFLVTSPSPNNETTESGGTRTVSLRLRSKPLADVTVPVASSKPTEGTASVSQLVFTPTNFDQAQTVTVTGVDDLVDDDDQVYALVLGAATSSDGRYAGLDPADVALVNKDDDAAAVLVGAPQPSAQTSEAGGTTSFTVKLATKPTADVTIGVTSSKPSEGIVSVASLVFTPADYDQPRTVTVTGQDDAVDDGSVAYSVVLAKATSADAKYAAIDPADVALSNIDDDTAGVAVSSPVPGSLTTETGASVSVTVVLQTQPTADVTIPISVSAANEATVDKAQLVFTPQTWNVPQSITVSGRDDAVDDDDVAYAVVLGTAVSADGVYTGMNPSDVPLTNVDDDVAGITVSAPAPGSTTTEAGGQITFQVVLTSRPVAQVSVAVASSKPAEGTADKAALVFAPEDWNVPQTVTVTGKDDGVIDDDVTYAIVLGPVTSADPKYAVIDPGDVALTNISMCGNGAVDAGEQCDDANGLACDGCERCERRRWLNLPNGVKASVASIAAALPPATGDLCVEAWARVPTAGDTVLVSSTSAGNDSAFLLRCQLSGGSSYVVFATESPNGLIQATQAGTGCNDGAWHHFAGCRRHVGGTVTATAFYDGVQVATASGPVSRVGANTTVVLNGTTYTGTDLNGSIDEVRISSAIRYTGAFAPARRLTADASTIALWHLDDGSGATFADASGNGFTGAIGVGGSFSVDTGYRAPLCQ